MNTHSVCFSTNCGRLAEELFPDSSKLSLPPIESEWLLRIVLFDNSLQLGGSTESRDNIVARRRELARGLREGRKKGVIPVFISFFWFVFALGLSIELAYDDIGVNETAHNLAMGLLVGWLPVLVVASTVDRNSVSADSVRERLNTLVKDVREALLNPSTFERYKTTTGSSETDLAWIETLQESDVFDDDFFVTFGGQGRTHFHYGVAHPILSGIETKFMVSTFQHSHCPQSSSRSYCNRSTAHILSGLYSLEMPIH